MAKQQLQTSRKFPKLHLILDNMLDVSSEQVNDRLQQFTTDQLDDVTVYQNDKLRNYWQICCNKSGQPLYQQSVSTMRTLLSNKGLQQTIAVLQTINAGATSPLWMQTDSDSLLQLSKTEPTSYFVYAASLFFAPYTKQATVLQRWKLQQQRAVCWQQATTSGDHAIDIKLIITANELLRRFLGLILPEKLRLKLSNANNDLLSATTASNAQLSNFIELIRATLKTVILSHINTKRAYPNKRLSQITHKALTEVQTVYTGRTDFRQQVRLKSLSKTDAVLYELQEIWEENFSAASTGWDSELATDDKQPAQAQGQTSPPAKLNLTQTATKRIVCRNNLSTLLAGKQVAPVHGCEPAPTTKLNFGSRKQ